MPKRIVVLVFTKDKIIAYKSIEEYIQSLSYYNATKLINRIKTIKSIR